MGRNNDVGSIKSKAWEYVLKTGYPEPAITGSKSNLGIHHPQLLRMIVPMSVLYKHGNEARYVICILTIALTFYFFRFSDDVLQGKYRIDHRSLPAFLYDVDTFNPRNTAASLLRGYFAARVGNNHQSCLLNANSLLLRSADTSLRAHRQQNSIVVSNDRPRRGMQKLLG